MKPSILLDDIEQKVIINRGMPFEWCIHYDSPHLESELAELKKRRPEYFVKSVAKSPSDPYYIPWEAYLDGGLC